MQWYENVVELIDMRSFSNLWYWIALAVLWSSLSHWILGVPFDMVIRARRRGGQAAADLADLVRIHVRRRMHIARAAGPWLVGFTALVLTTLGLLGFVYDVEFCQAVFLMLAPSALVGGMSIRLAARIEAEAPEGEALCRLLARYRFWIQVIGVIAIFITSMWGMWRNLSLGVLGG